jgi:hypothetical protein
MSAFKLLLTVGVVAAASAQAAVHEREFGRYVLRANVGPASDMSARAREANAPQPDSLVLDVAVVKNEPGRRSTIPAVVDAKVSEPGGATHKVTLRPVEVDGRVSYVGTIPVRASQVPLDFMINALPEDDTAMKMEFRDSGAPALR